MDDYIRAMRALWTMDRPRHSGPHVSFEGIDAHPRPVRPQGPPVVVGGDAGPALVRAVTMAEGWYGFTSTPPRPSSYSPTCGGSRASMRDRPSLGRSRSQRHHPVPRDRILRNIDTIASGGRRLGSVRTPERT
jgi:alkanesulfonate monooxygenase SsuD/methylene tetrahydromethanopterin reductase-like flavin-dependent oxidoreductase (luciferase family)